MKMRNKPNMANQEYFQTTGILYLFASIKFEFDKKHKFHLMNAGFS